MSLTVVNKSVQLFINIFLSISIFVIYLNIKIEDMLRI